MNSPYVLQLIDQYFDSDDGVLKIQSHSVASLAERYGTPFFVYDQSILENALNKLKASFGHEFSIYYSMKANPDPRIVRFFVEQASGIEIASIGEYRTAIQCGCVPNNIIFAGPGKTDAELREIINNGIGEIHAESETEIKRIDAIARSLGRNVNVGIRINPAAESQGGAMRMGGLAAPFGIDEEKVPDVISATSSLASVSICGIHLFTGTQILDAKTLASQYERFIDLATKISNQLNSPMLTVDFGGGHGIPYFENETPLDLESISSKLQSLPKQVQTNPALQGARLLIEPGRFLTAKCGIYVAKVLDIKESRGTRFVVTDGGMHHHLAASGNLGQVIKRNFPIACLTKLNRPNQEDYEIVGPLCTPLDRIGRKVPLPDIQIGDLIGVFNSGAYARSASPNDFLSHGRPVELYIDADSVSANSFDIEDKEDGGSN